MPEFNVKRSAIDQLANLGTLPSKPWPDTIRGISTESLDATTFGLLHCLKKFPCLQPGQLILSGKTFLVTGGSSGIGEKICLLAAELGAKVFNIDRDKASFDDQDAENPITSYDQDISDTKAVFNIVNEIGKHNGITNLVLNAGIFPKDRLEPGLDADEFDDRFDKLMAINGKGNIATFYAAYEYLLDLSNKGLDPSVAVIGTKNLSESTHPAYAIANAAKVQLLNAIDAACKKSYAALKKALDKAGSVEEKEKILDDYVYLRSFAIDPDAVFDTNIWGRTEEDRRTKITESAAQRGLTYDQYMKVANPAGLTFTSWQTAWSVINFSSHWNNALNPQHIKMDAGATASSFV